MKCPFCGKDNAIIDVNLVVCAKTNSAGELELITDIEDMKECLNDIHHSDMKGYCVDCGEEFIEVEYVEGKGLTLVPKRVRYASKYVYEEDKN